MAKKKAPATIFGITEFFGNFVELHASTWMEHVLIEHPQMAGYEGTLQQVLKDPYEIRESTSYVTGAAFISEPGLGSHLEGIRVLVNYNDGSYQKGATQGIIATAYPIDIVRYGNPKLGKTIYRKKK